MSISFSCPQCESRMVVPDNLAGKRGRCSKCKGPILVPGGDANGAASPAPAPAPRPAAKAAAPAPARPASPPPPPGKAPAPPTVNMEEEAAALLSDEPVEEDKAPEQIEFLCPQCDEPIQAAYEMAGKRQPCPHCRKIVPVPQPKVKRKEDWRDTGPKLPAGAKREELPELEGAWGTGAKAAVGHEALKEAGVIKEKAKPKTALQKLAPFALVLVPLMVIASGVWAYLAWRASTRERRALNVAVALLDSKKAAAAVGAEGEAALNAQVGRYFTRHRGKEPATAARDHLSRAITQAQGLKPPARDELLTDLVALLLDLGGEGEALDAGTRLKWDEVQRLLVSAISIVSSPEAQRDALRLACAGLASRGQTARVLPLATQAIRGDQLPRHAGLAVAGLELLRAGRADDARVAAAEAVKPYAGKGGPLPSAPVVALATALGSQPPKARNTAIENEPFQIGRAEGLALAGKLAEARTAAASLTNAPRAQLRARIALAAGALAAGGDASAAAQEAIDFLAQVPNRKELDWELVRLIRLGLEAGMPPEALDPVANSFPPVEPDHPTPPTAYARLLLLRERLKRSSQVEAPALADPIPADSLAGRLARLELARHNTRQDPAWTDTVNDWPEALQPFGSLGVALGLQRDP